MLHLFQAIPVSLNQIYLHLEFSIFTLQDLHFRILQEISRSTTLHHLPSDAPMRPSSKPAINLLLPIQVQNSLLLPPSKASPSMNSIKVQYSPTSPFCSCTFCNGRFSSRRCLRNISIISSQYRRQTRHKSAFQNPSRHLQG